MICPKQRVHVEEWMGWRVKQEPDRKRPRWIEMSRHGQTQLEFPFKDDCGCNEQDSLEEGKI